MAPESPTPQTPRPLAMESGAGGSGYGTRSRRPRPTEQTLPDRGRVMVEDGPARLSVPGNALPEDTAISVKLEEPSGFLPQGLLALGEIVVDLSGKTLGSTAELSLASEVVSPTDSLALARVERVEGVPKLVLVALASLVGDRVVSQPYPGLAGITTGGRYVFFRLSGPIGFVQGTTSSSAGPVKAVASTDGLPFVGIGTTAGQYLVPANPGLASLTATVPGTTLLGSGSVEVLAPEAVNVNVPRTVTLDISLTGTVTTATVTPADGAQGVSVTVQGEIQTSAPLKPETVLPGNVKLYKVEAAAETEVSVRLVLSGSRKVLAVVPQTALNYSTTYRLQASGLADVYGSAVSVPSATFRTRDFVAPEYDTTKLVFSMPDADGIVTLTAPPGTLAPGSEILIINSGNGFVATVTAENDGSVGNLIPATLPASISHSLLVTITDPLGNVTTFTRSQFENHATGETAIGPGGGTVKAADGSGVELRIPEGALEEGVTLKLTGFDLADLPQDQQQLPDFGDPGASGSVHFGRGLKIESADKPEFKKEVKLAFPLPGGLDGRGTCAAAAGGEPCAKDAFFYVVRKLDDGAGHVAFETLDQANVEGDGASAMVVTASWPFSGYANSFSSFSISPLGSFAIQAAATSYAYLMWSYDQLFPGRPVVGTVTGKVLRSKRNADGGQTLTGIKGALVTACDAQGHPLLVRGSDAAHPNVAQSQKDGTFTLWDASYAGGTVKVTAALSPADLHQGCQPVSADPNVRTATAYEVDPADSKTPPLLRRYRNVATVNVLFDPEAAPPPPAAIDIQVMKVEDGQRKATTGIVTQGTHLVLVLTTENADVRGATLNGAACVVTAEGPFSASVDLDTDPACHIGNPGTYNVTARALTPFLEVKDAARSFLVVAPGGNNTQPVSGPPAVVSVAPKAGAKGVPVTVFPQLVFSEPVVIGSSVSLRETTAGEDVPTTLLGVTRAGDVIDLRQDPDVAVTSLTIQPLTGLKYSTDYEIVLGSGILDLDAPPSELPSQTSSFTTFGPEAIGQTSGERYGSPGIYLYQDRAYLLQNNLFSWFCYSYIPGATWRVRALRHAAERWRRPAAWS